jgi:hypothetical protein
LEIEFMSLFIPLTVALSHFGAKILTALEAVLSFGIQSSSPLDESSIIARVTITLSGRKG